MNAIAMNITTIDTLAFSKRMQKVGLEPRVADELADALKETHSQSIENFPTKKDLDNKINYTESKLELKIEAIKNELIIRLGRAIYIATGLIISSIGLAVAIIKL